MIIWIYRAIIWIYRVINCFFVARYKNVGTVSPMGHRRNHIEILMDMEKKASMGGHSPVPAARSALALATTWIACVAGAYTWTDQWRISQKRERKFFSRSGNFPISDLQSWKVLGTVLQYSYFSVISRFPLKTVHPFQNFFAVLPPPTKCKPEIRKEFWIQVSNIVCGARAEVGPVWIGKRPRNAKVSQDFCPWLYIEPPLTWRSEFATSDLKKIYQRTRYAAYKQWNHNGVRLPTQQRFTLRTSSVSHSTRMYNIWWRKSSLPFLCFPYPAQNNNPKSRSPLALKFQIAELIYWRLGVCSPPESRRDYQVFSVPFPVSVLHWISTGSAVIGRIRLILILLTSSL